jgi:hypothetical protein
MLIKLMIHMKRRLLFFCARKMGFEINSIQSDLTSCKLPLNMTFKAGPVVSKSFVFSL